MIERLILKLAELMLLVLICLSALVWLLGVGCLSGCAWLWERVKA